MSEQKELLRCGCGWQTETPRTVGMPAKQGLVCPGCKQESTLGEMRVVDDFSSACQDIEPGPMPIPAAPRIPEVVASPRPPAKAPAIDKPDRPNAILQSVRRIASVLIAIIAAVAGYVSLGEVNGDYMLSAIWWLLVSLSLFRLSWFVWGR